MKKKKKWATLPMGLAVGLLSGFFGSGGGMVGVPLLRVLGLDTRECHATCIAVVAPLAAVSAWLYLADGAFYLSDAWIYIPGGIAGAAAGGWLLPKISGVWLRRAFGALIILAAVQLLTR